MKKKVLDKSIEELGLNKETIKILNDNSIIKVEDLWIKKRKELKDLGFSDSEIMQITIKLQLYGLDLNKKVY